MWEIASLIEVGGFNLLAAEVGVEEMIPLVFLVRNHGQCIAPVLPAAGSMAKYQVPDPITQPELFKAHQTKMASKLERQLRMLRFVGATPEHLQHGVIEEYRRS